MLQRCAFYLSVGIISAIGTSVITFIPLALHWGNAYHYGDLGYLCVQIRLGVGSFYSSIGAIGTIGTNGISFLSVGIPLVECMSLWGLRIFLWLIRLEECAFYSFIGTIGTIGTKGISFLSLSRWSVARAFPPGRFLNLILAHRKEVYIFNEARH